MLVIVFIYGLITGSFANVCISRIPEGISVVSPYSFCESCGHRLYFRDMIPVLNYVTSRGKCRYCNASYSVQHPIVETANAAIYALIYLKYGLNFVFVIYCLLSSLMLTISVIDIEHMIIPDSLNVVGMMLGTALMMNNSNLILDRMFGALIGFGIFMGIAYVTKSMGGGDVKLSAVMGFIFGIEGILFITILSFVLGAVSCLAMIILEMKKMKDMVPFGPFICAAAFLYIFTGAEIVNSYINFVMQMVE
ncbi:MAG: prepilin peptidase [Sedimentibacter sp.]|uniref:prepilin peptidase n=1 Tax=Sedimentibacter sp. TaxID=1960295 RepID=UPI003158CDC3